MSRMGREFSLVLLGTSILTAGYFLYPSADEELEKKADEQAQQQLHKDGAHSTTHRHYGGGHMLLWLHSPGFTGSYGNTRSPAMGTVARSGFGGIGRSASVGG
jgi:hypothetical protein